MGCACGKEKKTAYTLNTQENAKLKSNSINSLLILAEKRSSYHIVISSEKDDAENIEEISRDIIENIVGILK